MDYSKVNSALNGWVGSGARRDRAQAELGQALQLKQAQQQMQSEHNQSQQQLDDWAQHIQGMASQVAIRNEDKERVQAMYDQEKDTFLTELEKSGNDPVKFMNSGGRKTMQNFYNNIAFSEDAKRIQGNTKQVQAFYEQLEGDNGKNAHLIPNQVRREFDAYMNGSLDTFKHRQLIQWDTPGDKTQGNTLSDRYLNEGDNFMKFRQNYMNEFDLSPGEAENIPRETIEMYAAQYVGGGNPMQAMQPIVQQSNVNKSVAGRIQQQHRRMRPISTSMINKDSQEYKTALRDYDMGGFEFGVSPENTEVLGHRGFVGDELLLAKASLGKEKVTDLESYIPDVQAIGSWFSEDGESVMAGDDMGDLRPGAVFMGYKVKQPDGTFKLVKSEDMEGEPKNAEHTLIQEYESDDVLWFNSYYYNEINPNDAKVMTTYSKLKGEDGALAKYTAEATFEQQRPEPIKNIGMNSSVQELQLQLPNYDDKINRAMDVMGLGTKKNDNAKSILLSLAAVEGDINQGINGLVNRFNPNDFPELNEALMVGDNKKFYDLYYNMLTTNGVDSKAASSYLQQVDELREKMQKAQQ
tara:strand:+ start:19369 stop:21105 length:1737 start_codon:yes stop_codon:yes gene_type:complete